MDSANNLEIFFQLTDNLTSKDGFTLDKMSNLAGKKIILPA